MSKIILISGYMCDETIWQSTIKTFKNNYELIIPSLKNYKTVEEAAKSIGRHIDIDTSIIGFSMGGFISLQLAIKHSEIIKKLVIVSSNGRGISKIREKKLNKYLIESNQKNFADLFYKLHFDISFSKNYLDNKKYQNEYYEMTKNLGYQTFKNQTNLILNRPNQLQNLKKIKSKTLIINSSEDKLAPLSMSKELKEKIKNSRLKTIKNSSHFAMIEKPKIFNKTLLDFLK
jgi:pimeloyl-ACP methyl ester carboxylesterase